MHRATPSSQSEHESTLIYSLRPLVYKPEKKPRQRPSCNLLMSQIEDFLQVFPEIDFIVKIKQVETQRLLSTSLSLSAEDELKRMLVKAKRDLSKAVKGYKRGDITTEELFEWEWRCKELEEEIRRMRDMDSWDDLDLAD